MIKIQSTECDKWTTFDGLRFVIIIKNLCRLVCIIKLNFVFIYVSVIFYHLHIYINRFVFFFRIALFIECGCGCGASLFCECAFLSGLGGRSLDDTAFRDKRIERNHSNSFSSKPTNWETE